MNDAPGIQKSKTRSLGLPVLLAWCAIYLLLMAHGDWPWQGSGIMDFGSPARSSLQDFGAAIPTQIRAGAWQQLFLSPWLQHSLLSLLLLSLFWVSTARTLTSIAGTSRTWIFFVLGGIGGAVAHTWAHPELSSAGGAGPFDAIAAGVGAQLIWGFRSRAPGAARIRNSAIMTIVFVGALSWYFTKGTDRGAAVRAMMGFEAMVGGCVTGAVTMMLMGPRRVSQAAGTMTRTIALLLLAGLVGALVVQAPRAVASGERDQVQAFLQTLMSTELSAARLRDQRDASDRKRNSLHDQLQVLLSDPYLDEYEGAEAVRAYVEAMRAYTKPVRLPYLARDPCRKAFRTMYDTYEAPLRERVGMRPRFASEKYWERD